MLAEILFTSNHLLDQRLNTDPLTIENDIEMADVHEWIVRNKQDDLFAVYVDADPKDTESLMLACSCTEGTRDVACSHGLRVIRRIRADAEILARVLRKSVATPDTAESETELVS